MEDNFYSHGTLAMSGDIFGCHSLEGGGQVLLAPNGSGPGMLLTSYNAQDSPHNQRLSSPKC